MEPLKTDRENLEPLGWADRRTINRRGKSRENNEREESRTGMTPRESLELEIDDPKRRLIEESLMRIQTAKVSAQDEGKAVGSKAKIG